MNGTVTFSWQTIVAAASVLAAIVAILKYYNKGYDLLKHQGEQDKAIAAVKKQHEDDVKGIMEEQTLIIYGVLACLKGLHEQGSNGPVTEAIDKIEKHINKKAHGQN